MVWNHSSILRLQRCSPWSWAWISNSSHTLPDMWLLIHSGYTLYLINGNPAKHDNLVFCSTTASISGFLCGSISETPNKFGIWISQHSLQDVRVACASIYEASKVRDSGLNFSNPLKFDRHLGKCTAEVSFKFQIDTIIITSNLAVPRHREILRHDIRPLNE